MSNKILITGGTGFIGKNLIERLLQDKKAKIIVLGGNNIKHNQLFMKNFSNYKSRLKLVKIDFTKKESLDSIIEKIEVVVHLAAKSQFSNSKASLEELINTNIQGTRLILESVLKFNVKKFIFFSTSGVYGNKILGLPMDENHPLSPLNPYTKSKHEAEKIVLSFHEKFQLPVVILRLPNVYGQYQHPPWMIPLFVSRLMNNQSIFLNFEGKPRRDWIYIDDVINALIMLMKHKKNEIIGEIFNIGMGETKSNLEIASLIARKLGKNRKLIKLLKSGSVESTENMAVSNKINKMVGWKPIYSMDLGLRKTIEWIKRNNNLMK